MIMAKQQLLNAEVDSDGWSYTLLQHGQRVYRYKKKEIKIEELDRSDVVQATKLYERVGDEWMELTYIWEWMWKEDCDGPISIEDAMKQPWGKDIVPKSN